jgi:hypothetical protein
MLNLGGSLLNTSSIPRSGQLDMRIDPHDPLTSFIRSDSRIVRSSLALGAGASADTYPGSSMEMIDSMVELSGIEPLTSSLRIQVTDEQGTRPRKPERV